MHIKGSDALLKIVKMLLLSDWILNPQGVWYSYLINSTVKLEAPDGELLSICDKSKAEWYVRRGLGKLIEDTDSCFRVRLNFEPAGRIVWFPIWL